MKRYKPEKRRVTTIWLNVTVADLPIFSTFHKALRPGDDQHVRICRLLWASVLENLQELAYTNSGTSFPSMDDLTSAGKGI